MRAYIFSFLIFFSLFFFATCNNANEENINGLSQIRSLGVVFHKGVHLDGIAPENSLDAIALAHRIGAKAVEVDINLTADDEAILYHDDELDRGVRNAVDYSPLIEPLLLRGIPLDKLRSTYILEAETESMRRPIPTYKEALLLCSELHLYPFIELKSPNFTHKTLKKIYFEAVEILGKGNFAITTYSNMEYIKYLRKLDKDLLLCCDVMQNTNTLTRYKLEYYPNYLNLDEKVHQLSRYENRSTIVWTIPKEYFDQIQTTSVDAILSDFIAPDFNKAYTIYDNHSDLKFEQYKFTGRLERSLLKLDKGQSVTIKDYPQDNLYLGGIYIYIEMKGEINIKAPDFDVIRSNDRDDYKIYRFQYLLHNKNPYFEIVSTKDSTSVKSLWVAINKF